MYDKFRIPFVITATFILMLTAACSDDKIDPKAVTESFDKEVATLKTFNLEENTNNEPQPTGETYPSEETETHSCSVSKMRISSSSSEFFLLDPTTDIIYPGSILDGNSIPNGKYTPLLAERSPLIISVSIPTKNESSPSIEIDNPSLSAVRAATNNMLTSMSVDATPAFMQLTKNKVHNYNGISRTIGISYGDPVKSLGGTFTNTEAVDINRVVIKFVQKYYTIDVDIPNEPSDWFNNEAGLPSVSSFNNVSPVYVSSVTYGRMALITIESERSYDEIIATVNASLKCLPKNISEGSGGSSEEVDPGEIEASFTNEEKEIFESFKTNILVIGGSAIDAAKLVSINNLSEYSSALGDFINNGATWSSASPGVLLSYKLRHLSNNEIANIVLAEEYIVRDCTRKAFIYHVDMSYWNFSGFEDLGGNKNAELKGYIKGYIKDIGGNIIAQHTFWERSSSTKISTSDSYSGFDATKKLFVYKHDKKDDNNDVSAIGYTLLLNARLVDEDAWPNPDDTYSGSITINLGDNETVIASDLEKTIKVSSSGYSAYEYEPQSYQTGDATKDNYFKICFKLTTY